MIEFEEKQIGVIIHDLVEEAVSFSISTTKSSSKRSSKSRSDPKLTPELKPMPLPILQPIKQKSWVKSKSKMVKLHPNVADTPIDTIHQIWFQGQDDLKENEETLFENMERYKTVSGGKYFMWSETEIQSLIIQEFEEDVLIKYISLEGMMEKIQFAKYLILHHYGGFFVDMNTECKQSFAGLVNLAQSHGNKPLVCKFRKDPLNLQVTTAVIDKVIGDQFFYFSSPKHVFTSIMLELIQNDKPMDAEFVMHSIAEWMKRIKDKDKHVLIEQSLFITVVETDYISEYFVYQQVDEGGCSLM